MAVFIICEFDPFHYGHEYILSKAKRLNPGEPVVCVMSGNFVQRGRPALCDMYVRGACAVKGGADLVLSIPFPWCCASAGRFADGALAVISGLYRPGDKLVFGSECADAERLGRAARILSSPQFPERVAAYMKQTNIPYAEARAELLSDPQLTRSPNDILAVEYVRAASVLCPGLITAPVKRRGDLESATEIRSHADVAARLPDYAAKIVRSAGETASIGYAGGALLCHLREDPYRDAADGQSGLIGRLHDAACKARNIDETFALAATPQFTNARVRRVALYSFLHISDADLRKKPAFTVLTASDEEGGAFLSRTKKTRQIALVTKPSAANKLTGDAAGQYEAQCRADRLYCLCFGKARPASYFLRSTPYIAKGGAENE